MTLRPIAILAGATLFLGACAGQGPMESALSEATRGELRIQSVAVDVSAMGEVTKGRQVPASAVAAALEREAAALVGEGGGTSPARVEIDVTSVNLISAAQALMIGGESLMKGTVTVVDARSGQVVMPPTEVDAGGGGWVLGGVLGAATRDDPAKDLEDMSREFVQRTRVLVLGL